MSVDEQNAFSVTNFGALPIRGGGGFHKIRTVPVPKFGALPVSMSRKNKRMAPPRAVVFWCLAPKWAVDGTKYFSLGPGAINSDNCRPVFVDNLLHACICCTN